MIRLADGVVHVDAQGWRDLVLGGAAERAALERLPGMPQALAAVTHPLARLHLDLVAPGGRFTHLAWISRDAVALLRATRTDERRLLALPPDHLPVALARLTGLGPRRERDPRPQRLHGVALEQWFGGDDKAARASLVRVGADRAWALSVSPVDADPADALVMTAVDGPAGPRVVAYEGDELLLEPWTSTAVWRVFADVLPALDDTIARR